MLWKKPDYWTESITLIRLCRLRNCPSSGRHDMLENIHAKDHRVDSVERLKLWQFQCFPFRCFYCDCCALSVGPNAR